MCVPHSKKNRGTSQRKYLFFWGAPAKTGGAGRLPCKGKRLVHGVFHGGRSRDLRAKYPWMIDLLCRFARLVRMRGGRLGRTLFSHGRLTTAVGRTCAVLLLAAQADQVRAEQSITEQIR